MPRAGFLWRHVIINTRNTWLHGDERGFRSHNPQIRSSGDYKNRPPPEEYRKLREYFEKVAGDEVHFHRDLRPIVGRAILRHLMDHDYRTLSLAVGKVHAHVVVELPKTRAIVKRIIGEAKRKSSRAVKKWLPGLVWAGGGEFVICTNRSHLKNATEYVLYDQGPGAWTWSFRDSSEEGMFRAEATGATEIAARGGAALCPAVGEEKRLTEPRVAGASCVPVRLLRRCSKEAQSRCCARSRWSRAYRFSSSSSSRCR